MIVQGYTASRYGWNSKSVWGLALSHNHNNVLKFNSEYVDENFISFTMKYLLSGFFHIVHVIFF